MDGGASAASAGAGVGSRLHSTVRLNQFTLQFEDAALEGAYQAALHPRKKALWLRSLVPAAAAHVLFGTSDCLAHPVDNLLVTIPARLLLVMMQIAMFMLVRWDLVRAHESTMLLVSVANGLATLLLFSLQLPTLHQWDALFVVYGLSFYTIPKITPLGYVSSFFGSWSTAVVYAVLAFFVRRPPRLAESVMGMLYCVPAIWVFTTISYYAEYNSRERFVLRRRLRSESISLAVACTTTTTPAAEEPAADHLLRVFSLRRLSTVWLNNPTASYVLALALWAAFTLGSWTSLPDTLKFVDNETGWAWFSHCAGVTVFLLVMTRRLLWLMIVPVGGALILWMLTLTMPASWIIISAHSVGYGLLFVSVVIAMGVFSWFMCAWNELVSFLTRSCFLYPQLQAGMENDYPLLVKIVNEYTASFDPEILSGRLPASPAIKHSADDIVHATGPPSSGSRRRRSAGHRHDTANQTDRIDHDGSNDALTTITETPVAVKDHTAAPHRSRHVIGRDQATQVATVSSESDSDGVEGEARMVSVLPSFSPGKCFFCSKNDAEHLVPACGMWGKWTHWRMNQQHGLQDLSILASPFGKPLSKPVVSMCTSYYDLQNRNSELEARVHEVEKANHELKRQVGSFATREQEMSLAVVRLKAEIHAMQEKQTADAQRLERSHRDKVDAILSEANRAARVQKLELKKSETARAALRAQLSESAAATASAHDLAREADSKVANLEADLAALRAEVRALKTKRRASSVDTMTDASPTSLVLDESFASTSNSSPTASPLSNLVTLHPSGRLPYAQSLEIEGLRESVGTSQQHVDYAERWRDWQAGSTDY